MNTRGSAAPVSAVRRAAFGRVCPSKFMRIMASRSSSGPVHGYYQFWCQISNLIFAMFCRIQQYLAEWVQFFDRHGKLFPQQVHQTRNPAVPPATIMRWMFSPLAVARKKSKVF